jgi:multiple antibiotic resistance protein
VNEVVGNFLILLATIDPLGTLAFFVGLTANLSDAERRRVAFRCIGFSFAVLLAFLVAGQLLLGALGIALSSFQLSGGIIFFLFGLRMIFGSDTDVASAADPDHDVAIFPLAVPSIASPGSILAVVMLTDNDLVEIPDQVVTGLLLAGILLFTLLLLLLANQVYRIIGAAGANLLVRVLGLILAALATEMVIEAVTEIVRAANA